MHLLLKKYLIPAIFLCFIQLTLEAQLKPFFTIDKASGCAPLAVSFTNTTTGASDNAIYEWDFGNGNTSLLKDAGAVFLDAQTYAVMLTVKDSNKIVSVSQNITVYKKPVADFAASLQKGCLPLPITLTANATAGDGAITKYLWDFGDGVTEELSSSTVNHTYVAKQSPVISLSVTNSYGCQATVVKENVLTVLNELKASFNIDKKVLCTINDAASFINTTTGPGTLTYNWDFGDGQGSTAGNPSHVYTVKGTYTVKLIVNSAEGCKDTVQQNEILNVANFKSDWDTVGLLCEQNIIRITNKSVPVPDQSYWDFGNAYPQTTNNINVETWYPLSGIYTVKLTNTFGDCTDVLSKQIVINDIPHPNGFVIDVLGVCGAPVIVNFKDTTAGAVKWEWMGSYPNYFQATIQEPSFEYQSSGNHFMQLKVTNEKGCSNIAGKYFDIFRPVVQIKSPDISGNGSINSCGPISASFYTISNVDIAAWQWNFGDGGSSAAANPVHTFSIEGDYRVTLFYTTVTGCNGSVEFDGYVSIRNKVEADFTVSATDICGNTPLTITSNVTAPYYYHVWDMGDGVFQPYESRPSDITYQYQQEGIYTISLIITNAICADTVIKPNYIKVSPPFPKIAGFTRTCEGTRGLVTFNQTSKQANTWHWDFGDGATLALNTDQPQVQHEYKNTGYYKVVLTTSNGQCIVKDSIFVAVALKQNPILTGDQTEVCGTDNTLHLTLSNLEYIPGWRDESGYEYGYGTGGVYHTDGSYAYIASLNNLFSFLPGKEGLWMVLYNNFGCLDTTSTFPLITKGPVPGFKQENGNPCGNGNLVYLQDTSTSIGNVPIIKWEWNFGDGIEETYTTPGVITHNYFWPSTYPIRLKVIDANGCYAYFFGEANAETTTLNAGFIASATTVSPGTTVNFSNASTTSDIGHTTYKWLLGDGSQLTTTDMSEIYTVPGIYVVKLIAINTLTGCSDTASVTITVKYINAAFNIDQSYTSISQCPPVLVKFTNTSSNISKITWDFGDGTIVNNVLNPSHIYTQPGKYIITLVTESDNGTRYTTVDSITIKAPAATLSADLLHSCTAQTITLSAIAVNAANYVWDFGDGTVVQATATFSSHHYQAGVYEPKLIVLDTNGCAASATLGEKIIIDSLSVELNSLPDKICSPKEVFMNPGIVSIAAGQDQQTLAYHWDFGTGTNSDTAAIRTPSFTFQQPGNYNVSLTVKSPYGCVKTSNPVIAAFQGLGGGIAGPAAICEETTAQFAGTTLLQGQPIWQWIFHDGTVINQQNPPAKLYNDPGNYEVKLLVDNNGCVDTIKHLLQVNAKPVVSLSVNEAWLCEGSNLFVTASGGALYEWSPAAGLNTTAGPDIVASPVNDMVYTVAVTNTQGCGNTGSVNIKVVHPFTLQLANEATICSGKSIILHASGADNYQWIQNTTGLSNTQIPDPIATPVTSTTYTVKGTDIHNCFTDTKTINVKVQAAPTVNAGADMEIMAGTPYSLRPSASSDVTSWNWSPSTYLTCTNCADPQTNPLEQMNYVVKVSNAYGCSATDTITVKLLCNESRIFIPAAFTPNNDGLNDRFIIQSQGIQKINNLRIYNRWGEILFQRNNFTPGDQNASWNGMYKGLLVPSGVYIYMTEMSCNGQTFSRNGTVTVMY